MVARLLMLDKAGGDQAHEDNKSDHPATPVSPEGLKKIKTANWEADPAAR